jgi:hypothetical protein
MNNKSYIYFIFLAAAIWACGKERTFIYNGPSFVAFDEAFVTRDGSTTVNFIDSAITSPEGNSPSNGVRLRMVYAGKTNNDEPIRVNYSVRFIPDQVNTYFNVRSGFVNIRPGEHTADIVVTFSGDQVRTAPLSRSVEITLTGSEPELVMGYPGPNPDNNRNRKVIITIFEDDAN